MVGIPRLKTEAFSPIFCKRMYNSGFVFFTIGSLIAGLAQAQFHGTDLIAGRVIQGIGAALLITNSTVIVTDAFRKGQVGLGLGVNQIAGAAGFLIGPIIGGLLTEFSWRWVFLFNVPIGIFGALWGNWRLREPVRPLEHQTIDWFGTFSLSIGLFGLLLALTMFAFPILPQPVIITIFIIGLISLVLFAAIEWPGIHAHWSHEWAAFRSCWITPAYTYWAVHLCTWAVGVNND
jgi:MFS family permease